eukprot:m.89516 g.89516  ORF g.89516 m.89516 type:complete len:56 (+) comp13226_c0_seq3:2252-2419(+)
MDRDLSIKIKVGMFGVNSGQSFSSLQNCFFKSRPLSSSFSRFNQYLSMRMKTNAG